MGDNAFRNCLLLLVDPCLGRRIVFCMNTSHERRRRGRIDPKMSAHVLKGAQFGALVGYSVVESATQLDGK